MPKLFTQVQYLTKSESVNRMDDARQRQAFFGPRVRQQGQHVACSSGVSSAVNLTAFLPYILVIHAILRYANVMLPHRYTR